MPTGKLDPGAWLAGPPETEPTDGSERYFTAFRRVSLFHKHAASLIQMSSPDARFKPVLSPEALPLRCVSFNTVPLKPISSKALRACIAVPSDEALSTTISSTLSLG